MDVETYKAKKKSLIEAESAASARFRALCHVCRKAKATCCCGQIKPFASGPRFLVLIHPKEHRKRIGTGRLAHLCLRNSWLVEGIDFTRDSAVNDILRDPGCWPVVLYPGAEATDIGQDAATKLEELVPAGKTLVIIVIDGSWFCAKKMLRLSRNLSELPQIKFSPPHRSIYEIRRQPKSICFSSIEAVHFMIDQLAVSPRWRGEEGHDNLLDVFRHMIKQQLSYVLRPGQKAVRGERTRE